MKPNAADAETKEKPSGEIFPDGVFLLIQSLRPRTQRRPQWKAVSIWL